jgi:hypothetical protein
VVDSRELIIAAARRASVHIDRASVFVCRHKQVDAALCSETQRCRRVAVEVHERQLSNARVARRRRAQHRAQRVRTGARASVRILARAAQCVRGRDNGVIHEITAHGRRSVIACRLLRRAGIALAITVLAN